MLEECGLSNTADVAAKLIDEEVSWNDITEAHGSRGDIGVHNLLNGIVKTGGRAKIVKYLDQAQENAASSGAGGHMGGSSGGGKATPVQRLELSMRSPIINPVAHPVRRGSNKLLDRAGSIAPPPTPITHPEPASSPQSMSDKKVKKKRRKSKRTQ